MTSWWGILFMVVLAPLGLVWWAHWRAYDRRLRLPMVAQSFSVADQEFVPASIREGLVAASEELTDLGFHFIGYVQSAEFGTSTPRFQAVLRHPNAGAFAIVGFALSQVSGASIDLVTLFEDGWWLLTVNRRAHFFLGDFRTGRLGDALVATVSEQWRFHGDAVARETSRAIRQADLSALAAYRDALDEEEMRIAMESGDVLATADPKRFRMTPRGALRLGQRMRSGGARIAAAPRPEGKSASVRTPIDELERKYQTAVSTLAQIKSARSPRAFLISALAFVVSMLLFTHWAWVLWLIPVLLLHEMGHWAAMRLFGHRDVTIRFIPFFGAATMSTKRFEKLWHEIVVLLAGPVPGIVIALVIFQLSDIPHVRYGFAVAVTLISINSINLLPLHPLDGGRILHALVVAGRPWLNLALKSIAGAAFLIAAVVLKEPLLAVLALVGAVSVRSEVRLAHLEMAIRRLPQFHAAHAPAQRRALIFDVLSLGSETQPADWLQTVQRLEVSLGHRRPPWRHLVPCGLAYAACLGGIVLFMANVFSIGRHGLRCPVPERTVAVSCAPGSAFRQINWAHVAPGSLTRNPFKVISPSLPYPMAGFIWCTIEDGPGAVALADRLREAEAGAPYCAAFPWEKITGDGDLRRKARATVATLRLVQRMGDLATIDRIIDFRTKRATNDPNFDPTTARLYRATIDQGSPGADAATRELAARLGPSTTESCKRLKALPRSPSTRQ